jgi:hypothetical protein
MERDIGCKYFLSNGLGELKGSAPGWWFRFGRGGAVPLRFRFDLGVQFGEPWLRSDHNAIGMTETRGRKLQHFLKRRLQTSGPQGDDRHTDTGAPGDGGYRLRARKPTDTGAGGPSPALSLRSSSGRRQAGAAVRSDPCGGSARCPQPCHPASSTFPRVWAPPLRG